MSIDYRAELQRLVQAYDDHGGRWPQHHEDALHEAVEAARTTLAQPEPEGVGLTDGTRTWLPAAALAQPEPQGPTDEELWQIWHDVDGSIPTIFRAVLARFGRPAIVPVPVSERLPGEGDCDANGIFWAWDKGCLRWDAAFLDEAFPSDTDISHWLPHHALPVPQQEASK